MNKPNTYKVCSYSHTQMYIYHYRYYWQANLRSWINHNIFGLSCNTFKIDKLAAEHETLAKITAHLANGEDNQARAELLEMVGRLTGVADSLEIIEEV